jgi:hypothetical protein
MQDHLIEINRSTNEVSYYLLLVLHAKRAKRLHGNLAVKLKGWGTVGQCSCIMVASIPYAMIVLDNGTDN